MDEFTASSIATGGGGELFEQQVAAYALGLLLIRAIPPFLIDTTVVEVHLQTRREGWYTDDVLVVGERSDRSRRKLGVQVKRNLTISPNNEDCRKTFAGMWKDFHSLDRFNKLEDRLAIVVLEGTATLLHDFNLLLSFARASGSAENFYKRLSLDGYVSDKAKKQNETILAIIHEEENEQPNKTTYWQFLCTIDLLSLDFSQTNAQAKSNILTLLAHTIKDGSNSIDVAQNSWAKLLECVGEGRPVAKSFRYKDLPFTLRKQHKLVASNHHHDLHTLIEHGKTVRSGICRSLGADYEIDRTYQLHSLATKLTASQLVIVSGVAGSGKSALVCKLVDQFQDTYPILSFQAVEFAKPHIDEVLANAQTSLHMQQLLALFAVSDRVIIFIDGVEKLLEHSVRDALLQLLKFTKNEPSIRILLTVRDYSLDIVRDALVPRGTNPEIFQVNTLADSELDTIKNDVPQLSHALENRELRLLLRTPYMLDLATRLNWNRISGPMSLKDFRDTVWKYVIRVDEHTKGGLPQRREQMFQHIAWRRATQLSGFVRPELSDPEALNALMQDSLVAPSKDSHVFVAVTHDVLEDWCVLRWINDLFVESEGTLSLLAKEIGGYPALRRGFRQWLGEQFEINQMVAQSLVLSAIEHKKFPQHFKDDCLVAVLLSDSAAVFIENIQQKMLENDFELLKLVARVLRTACKKSPTWLNVPGVPSQMLLPKGMGWVPILRLIERSVDGLLPVHATLVLDIVEDWTKQINLSNRTPEGAEEAGNIASRLWSEFRGSRRDDLRKRLLHIVIRIPRAISLFPEILTLKKTPDQLDYQLNELRDLVLDDPEDSQVCYDFPDEVISLLNSQLKLSDSSTDYYRNAIDEIHYDFGVRHDDYFPPSALQGPFRSLLTYHPRKAIVFLTSFINHAAEWYGTKHRSNPELDPALQISLDISNKGTVKQWSNVRFYCLYRGSKVGPGSIVSALMALESWLLDLGDNQELDFENLLLDLLKRSNNVMITGVVASVCTAHPTRVGQAGLTLLSNREIVQMDKTRKALETSASSTAFHKLNASYRLFEEERKISNELKHRQEDLETLAVRMQLTSLREDVWGILDRHKHEAKLQVNEDNRHWRLALHRMDIRKFTVQNNFDDHQREASENNSPKVLLGPGELASDLKELVDEATESQSNFNRYVSLQNRALNIWKRGPQLGDEKCEKSLLAEAQFIDNGTDELEDFCRSGPGIVAAIYIRDHANDLNDIEFDWCVRRIDFEVHRTSETTDILEVESVAGILRADRVCACVVPILVTTTRKIDKCDPMDLLALSLTHPIWEVREFAFTGLSSFVEEEHKVLVLQCVAAVAYQARLTSEATETVRPVPFVKTAKGKCSFLSIERDVRRKIKKQNLDVNRELGSLNFQNSLSQKAIQYASVVFERHPDWIEARNFYSWIAVQLVEAWSSDHKSRGNTSRNYGFELAVGRALASFLLRVPRTEVLRISKPVIDIVVEKRRESVWFISDLISCADLNTEDSFWDIWQLISNTIVQSTWGRGLKDDHVRESAILSTIFLGNNWQGDAGRWHRLEGHAHLLDQLARDLPPTVPVLAAYLKFLYLIGQESLPRSFETVAQILEKGDSVRMASHSDIDFVLETLLRPFVYFHPHRVKTKASLREAVLAILDALVEGGSPSAYMMRDDFVTPSSQK